MYVLGITGGIATGKSAVTQMLSALGAPTISADAVAHALLAPGTDTTQAVLAAFPDCVGPDSETIDRRALGRRVFADAGARLRLEALTHPAIIAALKAEIAAWRGSCTAPAAAAEIPLLFEARLESLADRIVVVSCTESTQLARLQARLNVDAAEAGRLIAAQWPLSEKIARAHTVISTDGSLEDTRRQVEELWKVMA